MINFIIDRYKNDTYGVWQNTTDYKEFQPLALFKDKEHAIDYSLALEQTILGTTMIKRR